MLLQTYSKFKLLNVLGIVTVILNLAINLWTIDKGFIPSDEGWVMFLLADKVRGIATQGHLLFAPFTFLHDICINRLCGLGLLLVSNIAFAYGFSQWIEVRYGIRSMFWTVFGLGYLFSLNFIGYVMLAYNNMSYMAYHLSFAMMFLGFVRNKWIYYALSGLFISLLLPIKITCLSILPFEMLVIYLLSDSPKTSIWSFIGGLAAGFSYYLFVVISPYELIPWIVNNAPSPNDIADKDLHNGHFFKWWLEEAAIYYGRWMVVALILLLGFWLADKIRYVRVRQQILSLVAVGFIILYVCKIGTSFFYDFVHLEFLIWIAISAVLVLNLYYYRDRQILALLLLFVAPVCNAFGTDNFFPNSPFKLYIMFALLVCAFALKLPKICQMVYGNVIAAFFILAICISVYQCCNDLHSWHKDVFVQQTVELRSIGVDQDIKVDPATICRLQFYKSHIPPEADVLCSAGNWGDAYLLGFKPLDYVYNLIDIEPVKSKVRVCVESGRPVYILYSNDGRYGSYVNDISKEYVVDFYKLGNNNCAVIRSKLH